MCAFCTFWASETILSVQYVSSIALVTSGAADNSSVRSRHISLQWFSFSLTAGQLPVTSSSYIFAIILNLCIADLTIRSLSAQEINQTICHREARTLPTVISVCSRPKVMCADMRISIWPSKTHYRVKLCRNPTSSLRVIFSPGWRSRSNVTEI